MKITNLGHTECLVECTLKNGEIFRFLLDSWLSDYSVADLMERSQRVTIDWSVFPKIDVLYLSHSHMDHIDPYFLTELYKHQSPTLLLAETLEYLAPVFKKYLPVDGKIELLRHMQPSIFCSEVEITGLIYCTDAIGNEEDVVTVFISHNETAAYFEVDTLPPMIYEEQELLVSLLTSKKFESIAYVASSNELEGNLAIFDYGTKKSQDSFVRTHTQQRKEAIEEQYDITFEHELPLEILAKLPLHTVFIGQGLRFPKSLSTPLSRLRFLPLEEIAEMHKNAAKAVNYQRSYSALNGGETLIVGKKSNQSINPNQSTFSNQASLSDKTSLSNPVIIKSGKGTFSINTHSIPGLTVEKRETPSREVFVQFTRIAGPLDGDIEESIDSQEKRIIECIQNRFIPTKSADSSDNLKQIILQSPNRAYTIAIQYGNKPPYETRHYSWSFGTKTVVRTNISTTSDSIVNKLDNTTYDELYFGNDLINFLDGKQELYCNFFHALDSSKMYRLWTVLGNNFINHDLVEKKLELHFKRSKEGKTPDTFVQSLITSRYTITPQ